MKNNNKKYTTMKLKHFYVSVCMVLVSILSINAQTSVTLTQAGTLSSKLPASEADRAKINELIINERIY